MLPVIVLSITSIVSCTASTPVSFTITTNTAIPIKTPISPTIITSTPEPSSTPTLFPPISSLTEVISIKNINQLQLLGTRRLAGISQDFLHRKLDFTPDGRIIAGDYDTIVYVWDGLTGQPIITLDHSFYLWNVAISPDGKMVASGGESSIIKVWDFKTGKEIHRFFHRGTIWSLAFSSDNSMLASGTLDQSVKIWNLVDGKELDYIDDIKVNSLAFSPDDGLLAIGTVDKIILWNVITKSPFKTFFFDLRREHGLSGIQGVLFSPDGEMIAAANGDNIAIVWNVTSEEKVSTIVGKGTFIAMSEGTLTFSPDSKMLATGNDNGEIIIWDVYTDKELKRINSPICIPWDLIFWTDGKAIEVVCWNGVIQLWGLP